MYAAAHIASLTTHEIDALFHDVVTTAKNRLEEADTRRSMSQVAVWTAMALGAFGHYSDPASPQWTSIVNQQLDYLRNALLAMTGAVLRTESVSWRKDAIFYLGNLESMFHNTLERRRREAAAS